MKATAKVKAGLPAPPKAPSAGSPYGCSKCRWSASGCLRCNPDKYAKSLDKKSVADDAEIPEGIKSAPEKEDGGAVGAWEHIEEAELLMPADAQGEQESELPDDFNGDEGELDHEAKELLEKAFALSDAVS